MIFCPSNAHNSIAQSFPEKKYSFTARMSLCIVRESNPCQQLGRLLCYHYTNDAENVYDRRYESQNFQTWIFPYTFSKCHSKKKPKKFFEKRSKIFANQTNLFSFIESCCCFWFVDSQGQWELKKRQEFTISWIFCHSNAHNSNAQSFPDIKYSFTARLSAQFFPKIKYSFTARLSLCIVRESNPCQQLGRLLCYHYTNDAENVYDRRYESQNFQTWIFPYTFSKCHSKKKPKNFFEKRSKFFANQTNLFSFIESCCCFWFVDSQGQWELKKRQEFTISWYFVPLTHTIVLLNLSLKINILLTRVWVYASYGNRTHVNSLEGCYATTTPTMLRMFTIVDMNLRTFKHEFFLTHFLSVTARKNQRNSLGSGVNFSLTRPICSHSSKAVVVSGFLNLKVNGNLKNDKNLLFHDILSLWRTQ